jgi:hypothetical protein
MVSVMPNKPLDMHLSDADEPDECRWLLSNDFRAPHGIYSMHVPSDYHWFRYPPGILETDDYYPLLMRL